MEERRLRWEAIDIYDAAVDAATPQMELPDVDIDAAAGQLIVGPHRINTSGLRRVVVVGAGKGADRLGRALAFSATRGLSPRPDAEGLILVPEPPASASDALDLEGAGRSAIQLQAFAGFWEIAPVRPRDANQPTDASVAATARVLELARSLGPDDLLLCAFTGGGSALLCAPAEGVPLADKIEAVELLTADGAPIEELNTLRRHLSAVKGGRLAQAAAGARAVVSVLVSDVDGDDPSVIASGPCIADGTTFQDALDLREEWPARVLRHLRRGVDGEIPDTPDTLPENVVSHVALTPNNALFGAYTHAQNSDWSVVTLPRPTPSRLAGCIEAHLDAMRRAKDGTAILSIGEAPTELPWAVPLGGRAGHLALAIAVAADADPQLRDRFTVLVGATDGEDGTSGTAGGIVDGTVLRRAESAGLDPAGMLDRCESLAVLRTGGGVLPAQATGTNVQDLRVILIAPSS